MFETAQLCRKKRGNSGSSGANGGVSPPVGKRLRVVDFRAILCERDDAHTLWYVLGVIVQKRAERCRYQPLASRIDTAQSKKRKGTKGL